MVKCVRNEKISTNEEKKKHSRGRWGPLYIFASLRFFYVCYQTVGPCKYNCSFLHADHRPGVVLSIFCVLAQPDTDTFYRQENSHSSKVTLPIRGDRTGFWVPTVWLLSLCLSLLHPTAFSPECICFLLFSLNSASPGLNLSLLNDEKYTISLAHHHLSSILTIELSVWFQFFGLCKRCCKNLLAFSSKWMLLMLWPRFSVGGLLDQSAHAFKKILIDVVRWVFEYS